jgi:hypothetical protein
LREIDEIDEIAKSLKLQVCNVKMEAHFVFLCVLGGLARNHIYFFFSQIAQICTDED